MTQSEVTALFNTLPFAAARAALIDEAQKNGHKVDSDSISMMELMRLATSSVANTSVVCGCDMAGTVERSDPPAHPATPATATKVLKELPPVVLGMSKELIDEAVPTAPVPPSAVKKRNTPSWKSIAEDLQRKLEEANKKLKDGGGGVASPTAPSVGGGGVSAENIADIAKAVAEALKPPAKEEEVKPSGVRKDAVELCTNANGWSPKPNPKKVEAVKLLKKFLSEFSLFAKGCSARFLNTFCASKPEERTAFVTAYAEVAKEERLDDLKAKLKSPEWAKVLDAFASITATHLNKRLACFYGEPGGGKTYQAVTIGKEANGDNMVDVMPCHAGMDPAQLLFEYKMDYESGRKGFVPSALLIAMTEGRALVMDEINLLPTESVMFLQNVTDNKDEVFVMGQSFSIKDGFFIIGTMNIETGLGTIPLPPALADRCAIIKEFKMNSAQLVAAAALEDSYA